MVDIYNLFDSLAATEIPVNLPKGGTTYHYVWNDNAKKDDWRADGYRWRQNGNSKQKFQSGLVKKTYFKVFDGPQSVSGLFTRTAYTRENRPQALIIEYKGDESIAGQFPHGHTKYGSRPHVRTQPSVIRHIESASASAPSRIYQTMVTAGAEERNQTTAVPRNLEQVRNTLKQQRNRRRYSRDALFNLHELAQDSNFIRHITTYPDLSVILYHPDVVKIFKNTLSTSGDLPT